MQSALQSTLQFCNRSILEATGEMKGSSDIALRKQVETLALK